MRFIIILIVLLTLIFVAYWKRDDLFGSDGGLRDGKNGVTPGILGDDCKTNTCALTLVCDSDLWTCQPAPIPVYFDLQAWEASQTHHPRDGSIYTTAESDHGTYGDAWGLRMVGGVELQMFENVSFPLANTSFKFEVIWRDHGDDDGTSSYGFVFRIGSDYNAFNFQRIEHKLQAFVFKSDGALSLILGAQILGAVPQAADPPQDKIYRNVFIYNVETGEYTHDHFEGADLYNIVNQSTNGSVSEADGEWGYKPSHDSTVNKKYNLISYAYGHEILYMRLSGI